MARNQKGGVHTQKLKTFGIIAMLVLATALVIIPADISSATNSVSADQFAKKGTAVTFDLEGDSSYNYTAVLTDSNGKEMSGAISSSDAKGSLGSDAKKTISVTAPSTAGNYTLTVKYFSDESYEQQVWSVQRTLKSVDPIVLKATITNSGDVDMPLSVYFVVNGEKVDDSVQTVTVAKGGSKDVTYDYVVDGVSDFKFTLESDGFIDGSIISGLGDEKSVYASANDYTVLTAVLVVVLIITLIAMALILRKPVVNTGKPKARR